VGGAAGYGSSTNINGYGAIPIPTKNENQQTNGLGWLFGLS
jgi:hypothetical protein